MNKDKNLKNIIDTRLSALTISEEIENKIVSGLCSNKRKSRRPLSIVAAIVCAFILITVPAMADKLPSFNKLLYLISPRTAQLLQPVELVSESNGIKMEVVAAINDDETAIVYLTLQDLSGRSRVDKTVDLYNYSIYGTNTFTHEIIDYNEETQTATIRMLANGGNKLNGKKVSVRVDSFLSGKEYFKNVDAEVNLADIVKRTPQTISLNMNNIPGGSGNLFNELKEKGTINVLKTDQTNIKLPGIDFVGISNTGFVDGRFHVQTKWTESIDNHGYLYLANSKGDQVNPSNIYFAVDEKGETKYGREYIEYIFEVQPNQIENYSLKGDFVKNSNYIEGKWQTTFEIKSIDNAVKVAGNIDLGGVKIGKVTVTPIGVNVIGGSTTANDLDINITMNDGRVLALNNTVSNESNGKRNIKFMSSGPIEVENVKEVRINNEVIKFD